MAQYQTADGRWIVGNVSGDSNYHGFLGWRDCVIQLTADGATEQSVRYLEALRDYALAHNPLGEPIMPPSINVWISNNGTTTAIQADDLSIDGDKFTIGGIVWNGSAWDYSDAGKASGGGSGYTVTEERVVVIPEQTVEFEEGSNGTGRAFFQYSLSDAPNVMYVSFNGQEYALDRKESISFGKYYGEVEEKSGPFGSFDAPSFANYPVCLQIREAVEEGEQTKIAVFVEEPGTNTIKAEAVTKTITPSDDFKEAVAKASVPFVVTLTPTAADYSGTMDKTVGEIYEAYQAGRRIVFKVDGGDGSCTYADCTMQYTGISAVYPSFNAFIIDNARNILIFAYTGATSSATDSAYDTQIYTLTPAT